MAMAELNDDHKHDTLSVNSIRHALAVLAEATNATTVLFNPSGEVLAGPVAGSEFVRQLLSSVEGRLAVLSAHRSAFSAGTDEASQAAQLLTEVSLDYIAIPVHRDGECLGALTMGDRPHKPIPTAKVRRLATVAGLDADLLIHAARQLVCWNENDASAARNMGALVVELLADLFLQDKDLHRRTKELRAVYNIAGLFAGTLDLKKILDRTAEMVCRVMQVKACSIRMLDEATGQLHIKAVHNLSAEYLNKGHVSVEQNPIDAAAIAGEIVRIADAPTDPRTRYPKQARKEGIVSGLVCGMIYRGKAVGVIRVYTGELHTFTPYEESLLQAVASQAASAIVNARLAAEALEAERYARQIAYAGDVQRQMIPANPPEIKNVAIGTVYRPTFEVGGDFYDFISLPKGNTGICIADVCGKGVPASLMMASLRSALRVYAYFTYDVERVMAEANRHMWRDTKPSEFVTAFYGVLTPDGRRLTYCNAGHNPPLLLRDGRIQQLRTGGMVLGVDPEAKFERGLLELQPLDVLLLYTDGAVEASNFNDEQFGLERLIESLGRWADQPVQLLAQNIDWDVRRFEGLADRTDDLTLVALKIK